MFCPKCGKEIEDGVNFCPNCGYDRNGIRGRNASAGMIESLDGLFKKFDSSWIIKRISIIFAVISLIARIFCNETITVVYGLALEDYYAISHSGECIIIASCLLSALLSAGIVYYCRKRELSAEWKSLIATGIGIAVSIFLMLIRIPAPY